MPRVTVNGPEGRIEHSLELEASGTVLFGRSPRPEDLPAVLATGSDPPALREVAVPSVSANHVVAWNSEGSVFVEDLSRNGTWLLLPRGEPVCVGKHDAVLQLSRAGTEPMSGDELPSASWTGKHEFAGSLATAVKQWPRLKGLDVEVRISRRDDSGGLSGIPLATGQALELVPRTTTDANWSGLIEHLWRWVSRQNSILEAEEQTRNEGMILASSAIRSAHRDVVEAARSGARALLLTGPSGAGKEMLAEVFHRHSRRSGPLVPVNCSMFSKELLRSELFGAEAGSFTSATRRIVGAVERAQGGTLFLDEVADMPSDVQPMLLRFLDRHEYENLGRYGKASHADICVVAATNKDLRGAIRVGTFRADLWYRLSVQVVDIPALRSRWDDIAAFLESTPLAGGRHTLLDALSEPALEVLRKYTWDGNFRELTNFRERLSRDALPGSISAEVCRQALERGSLTSIAPPSPQRSPNETPSDWAALATRAVTAFVEDRGHEPTSWDDQKDWNEKYLKPLLFQHLSGNEAQPAPADEDALAALASRSAARVRADRGTALKQLARYYERYRG